ncbi:MAG: elongation factor P [Candidatus Marinimicrobia bacterium]|nr:elongation factor P [Candidatus Neomarinimicrobiota bacterium]
MATTSDFRNGFVFRQKNGLWKIVEFLHVKPGKGPAFVRTKLKNVRTGQVVEETFRAGEKVEEVRVEAKNTTYQYHDGDSFYFMDNSTYEQIALSRDQLGDIIDFLVDNLEVTIAFDGADPVEIRIPQHMNLKISKTEPGVRGDTATGGSKPATLETGVVVQVPLFLNEGETVRIDTKDRRYIERVKESSI